DGASYYYGYVPAASTCTAYDLLSGQDGCTISDYGTSIGNHTIVAEALDRAGNRYRETRTYSVLPWNLKGFYQPVDMGNIWNTVKNGSTVPLKFEIFAGPTELVEVSDVKSLFSKQVACTTLPGAAEDAIETISATSSTLLRYDVTAGQFVFNWKTPNMAGKCYQVTMTSQDGSTLTAFFKLK
ncbi:MAG: PxKF domain-containing protein, partial [Anaerolineaceae bacterium]